MNTLSPKVFPPTLIDVWKKHHTVVITLIALTSYRKMNKSKKDIVTHS